METRVEDIGVLKMEEVQKGGEDRVSGETVEKRDGSDGDVTSELTVAVTEGEEVFEEAVDTQSNLLQDEDAKDGLDGGVDAVEDLSEAVVEGISSKEIEVEEFEEAIGVPGEAGKHVDEVEVVQVEEKTDVPKGEENADRVLLADVVDDGGTTKEVTSSVNELSVNGENDVKEMASVGGDLHGEEEPAEQIDPAVDTSVDIDATEEVVGGNGDLHNDGESVDQLDAGVNISAKGDEPKEVVDGGGDPHNAGESGEKIEIENSVEEKVELRAEDDRDVDVLKEERTVVHQDGISGSNEDGQSDASKVKGWSNENQVEESRELNVASDSNPMEDLDAKEIKLDKETTGHINGDLQGTSASTVSGSQDAVGEKIKETTVGVVHQDDKTKDVLVGQDGDGGNVSQENAALPFTYKAVLERAIIAENQSSVPPNESKIEQNERMLDDNTVKRVAESSVPPNESKIEKSERMLEDNTAKRVAESSVPPNESKREKNEKMLEDKTVKRVAESSPSLLVGESQERGAEAGKQERENSKDGNISREAIGKNEIQPASELASSSGKSSIQAPLPASEPASSSGKSSIQAPLPARPAGLGRAAALLEPAPRAPVQPRVNGSVSPVPSQQIEESSNGETEDHDETREKLQMIRVKFLRLAHRLGQTPHNVVVAQVLYRLGLAEQLRGRNGGRVGAFSFDRASAMAEQLEASGQAPLDFSCTIMVLGKTGVGKSATINSIFDEVKFNTDAFDMGTKKVQDVVGTVQGIKVRVIDTPGLLPSWTDQRHNEKILHSVKRFIKKTPPDIVLYLDRMDVQSRDLGDMPLLRTITDIFGPSIWFNAIVVLTHAASAPPDGPNGIASSYDMFVTQRSHVVQQAIRQAAGDMRLMNPVSLVENHSACRTNRAGQRVLPNGQVWKPHLLLLSFASKILAEANTLLKLQDSPPGKPFAPRSRATPLPYLLSTLLQPRAQVKLPEEQFGDEDGADDDIDESSDSDDEPDYDELPPFKWLTKAQLSNLTKAQKKAYFDELEYRERLFMKKQLKEEKRRRQMMKKMAAEQKDQPSEYGDNVEEESGGPASVPVPMPDLALPASFDSDNPTHRYRYLDTSNQWLVRPVLDSQGWDHDVGYEGINVERLFVVKDKVPISFSGQVTKDKKDANIQMEVASSIKHGEGKATSLGLDMQTVGGKDLAYTLRGETRFCNFRKNKATAGLSMTFLHDALSAGIKVEDKLIANKRFRLVMTGGAMTSRGDIAYGGSLDATLRDKEYPLGRSLFTLGLSVMDWHGDLAIGGNVQSQLPIGRSSNLIARANLNNRGSGQVSVRVNSSEQLQIALVALIPLIKKLLVFPQQLQFGQ